MKGHGYYRIIESCKHSLLVRIGLLALFSFVFELVLFGVFAMRADANRSSVFQDPYLRAPEIKVWILVGVITPVAVWLLFVLPRLLKKRQLEKAYRAFLTRRFVRRSSVEKAKKKRDSLARAAEEERISQLRAAEEERKSQLRAAEEASIKKYMLEHPEVYLSLMEKSLLAEATSGHLGLPFRGHVIHEDGARRIVVYEIVTSNASINYGPSDSINWSYYLLGTENGWIESTTWVSSESKTYFDGVDEGDENITLRQSGTEGGYGGMRSRVSNIVFKKADLKAYKNPIGGTFTLATFFRAKLEEVIDMLAHALWERRHNGPGAWNSRLKTTIQGLEKARGVLGHLVPSLNHCVQEIQGALSDHDAGDHD